MTLEAGGRLGHYRILGLLGRGGMAAVYRAEDERLEREVALKVLPPEFAWDPDRVERFEREVRAAAKLTHPNIVTVHEFGREGEQPFYTMALMRGGDLKARIRAHPEGMLPEEARGIALAVTRALAYAHGEGFVHRDVKPENVLFGQDGAPQLTDFGIARAMSSGTRMTATGMSIGSPHYMSPEQARGQVVDGRSDVYSLGVVLYEMLTGRAPFDAADTFAVAYSHINDPVPALPGHLAGWQPLLDRLLAKSPEDRYGSARELTEALASGALPTASDIQAGAVPEASLAPPGTRVISRARDAGRTAVAKEFVPDRAVEAGRPRHGSLAVAAGAALALGVVGILYFTSREGPDRLSSGDGGDTAGVGTGRSANSSPPAGSGDRNRREAASDPLAGASRVFDGMEFVWIPPGEFRMGSTSSEADRDERTVTRVRISRGFWLGKHEVTQSEWESVMGSNPSRFSDCGGDCPAERVSWEDVQEFTGRLNGREGRDVYRLPTEAEWEYAARAGTTGDRYGSLDSIAWWRENSGGRTHPVGGKSANAWGLHDMLGNVWEWVQDRSGASYPGLTVTDPRGPGSGSGRVRRGGSWGNSARIARASNRSSIDPGFRLIYLGFRLLRTTR